MIDHEPAMYGCGGDPIDDDLADARRAANQARDRRDAARYRWLRRQKALSLTTDGSIWTGADGERFVSSHRLCAGGTQFGPGATLDAVIDAAVKVQDE